MNKKGSMELSVNSIVILVIAIVMLGLILGFVKSRLNTLTPQLVTDEREAPIATPSDKLTVSRETVAVSGGEEVTLKVQVYAVRDIKNNSLDHSVYQPTITCMGNLVLPITVQLKNVAQGDVATYTMIIKVPGVSAGKYLCSLGFTFPLDASTTPAGPAITLSKDLEFDIS
jgi:hypothetical protein